MTNSFNLSELRDKRKRATAKDVEVAAKVGNLQMKFFEENGRFPTDEEAREFILNKVGAVRAVLM